ncbi:MAG: ABC transporter permease subunit [Gemmataceae bacterium]|nr:ABC transporter permease subunit [Gemmataceae bacterium]
MAGRKRRSLPGFGLSLGFTLTYLSLLVLLPLAACVVKAASLSWSEFWRVVTDPVAVAAYRLSFTTSLIAALLNAVFGLAIAWVLVRYEFPGRKLLDALVDLPLALPTAVAGITFADLYSTDGWFGRYLTFLEPDGAVGAFFGPEGWFGRNLTPIDVRTHGGPLAIVVVLMFVGLPFVIRSVQPVLADFEAEQEEAAASMGATRWQTFRYVILPSLVPAWLTGFTLAYARGLGEYGSVIFVADGIPGESVIPPVLIVSRLEEFDRERGAFKYEEAAAIAVVLLFFSLVTLIAINLLERWSKRFEPTEA